MPNLDPSSNRQQPHSMLGFPVPPVTILVPCPIVIPLPIPIPIPIPLIDFLKATNPKSPKVEPSVSQSPVPHPTESQRMADTREDVSDPEDCPLDFTTVSHDQRRQQEQELAITRRSSYSLEPIIVGDSKGPDEADRSPEHKLPKFKITRLNLRRLVAEEGPGDVCVAEKVREQRSPEEKEADHCREMVERSRPLRKRKRVVGHHEEQMAREEDSGGAKG